MINLFIPIVTKINGTQVPTTPFKSNNGKDISLGDVIRIHLTDGMAQTEGLLQNLFFEKPSEEIEPECFLVELKEGKYQATSQTESKAVDIYFLGEEQIENLGSSILNPELLNLLTI